MKLRMRLLVALMNRTPVLGLTGGIASGKSAVAQLFRQQGATLIDADQIAHRLMLPGQVGAQRIKKVFGAAYFHADGQLNRQKLGQLVFNDQAALDKLNTLLQTLIRTEIIQAIAAAQLQVQPLIVIEIPLLFEQHYQPLCDRILVVTISPEIQVQRLQQRNHLTAVDAKARIAAQVAPEVRLAGADFLISGDRDLQSLQKSFTQLWQSPSFQRFLGQPVGK